METKELVKHFCTHNYEFCHRKDNKRKLGPKPGPDPPEMTQKGPKWTQILTDLPYNMTKMAKKGLNSVKRRAYTSPDILRLKPENISFRCSTAGPCLAQLLIMLL